MNTTLNGTAGAPLVLPSGSPVLDWAHLAAGDHVEVMDDGGTLTPARIDTLNPDGSIIWLTPDGTGQRVLHLVTDPVTIYKG